MLEHYLSLAVKAIFVENMALAFFLGMCSFLAVSRQVKTAIGLGGAVIFVLTITVPMNNIIYAVLVASGRHGVDPPRRWLQYDLSFLGFLSYIGTIAAMVQIVEMTLDRFAPAAPRGAWDLSAADRRQLRDPRRVPLYGRAELHAGREHRVRPWLRASAGRWRSSRSPGFGSGLRYSQPARRPARARA